MSLLNLVRIGTPTFNSTENQRKQMTRLKTQNNMTGYIKDLEFLIESITEEHSLPKR